MSIIWAAFLGLVQGLAEFLPISSSGHLSILQNLFGMQTTGEGHMFFDVLLHMGTLIAVCVVYWRDIVSMFWDVIGIFRGEGIENEEHRLKPSLRQVLMILVATLPLFLILPLNDYIEQLYYSTTFIGAVLILTGCMLYISDKMAPGKKNATSMTLGDALKIGICQAVATIPGLSRSGTTITAGMATGLSRNYAVKFSFLISLPAVFGAALLNLIKAIKTGIDISLLPAYLVGMLAAMISGYFALSLLRLLTQKGKFGKFAYYCWGIGVLAILLSIIL